MEFSFNVNDMLPDLITLVDEKLAPFRSRVKNDRFEFASKQNQLKILIDKMGEASTRAQGLRTPITSAIKLQNSDYRLYIMKDPSANNGLGAAVGILKVGHKRLFLLDMQSVQYEVYPLCVLDFYVHESRQRTGCGKRLFEHMMKVCIQAPFARIWTPLDLSRQSWILDWGNSAIPASRIRGLH